MHIMGSFKFIILAKLESDNNSFIWILNSGELSSIESLEKSNIRCSL